jgi:hypothetical protein
MQDLYVLAGVGQANQATYWAGSSSLSGDSGFTWDNTNEFVKIQGDVGKQLRLGYDASNYFDMAVGSSGVLTGTLTGTSTGLTLTGSLAGELALSFTNTSANAAAGSVVLIGTPTTGGDAYFSLRITGGGSRWAVGVDNSDGDSLKFVPGATPSDNAAIKIDTSRNIFFPDFTQGSVLFVGANGEVIENNASLFWDNSDVALTIDKSDTATTPMLDLIQSSTGDAALRLAIGTTKSYAFGVDNSATNDPIKISYAASGSAALGTTDIHQFTDRFSGDGLINDGDASTVGTGWHRIYGNAANEYLDLTWYKFGSALLFRNERIAAGVGCFEIFAYRTGTSVYTACASFLGSDTGNSVQCRNVGDTDAIRMDFDSAGPVLYTESNASMDLGVAATRYARLTSTKLKFVGGFSIGISQDSSLATADEWTLTDNAAGTMVLAFQGSNKFGWDNANFYAFAGSLYSLSGSNYLQLVHDGTDARVIAGVAGDISLEPFAKVRVIQGTIGNEIFRLQTTATNDDPADKYYHGRVATTDATVTTINTVAISASNTYLIEARVRARRTGGTAGTADDAASYIVRGTYKTASGTVTLVGSLSAEYTAEDVAGYDATLTISGTNVLVRVTGVADTNITWHSTVHVVNVGS